MSATPPNGTTRRNILRGAAGAAAVAALPAFGAARSALRPNILFILADDLGYADLSCYGRRDYRTPVLDRLSNDGMMLTQAYANSAVCSPTRVALITGRYNQRLAAGLPEPIRTAVLDPVGLPKGQATLPGLMRRAGYQTALVGKWHMGWPPIHGPLAAGYDSFFGVAAGGVDHFTHREHGTNVRNRAGLYEGNGVVSRQGYLTDLLTERAIEEVRATAKSEHPFFLSLHYTAPHWPWQGPGDKETSANITDLRHDDGGSLDKFGEMVVALDAGVGRVLQELQRLGIADDTLVVFTSDNGGERFSDTWPLRGGKGELLEGGIRVPAIIRWPGRIAAGGKSEQVMASMDWLPTLLSAAQLVPDPALALDGEDLCDVLVGTQPPHARELYWRMTARGQAAVREGDWKFLRIDNEEFLFNVITDPRERANLKMREHEKFDQLKDKFDRWNADVNRGLELKAAL